MGCGWLGVESWQPAPTKYDIAARAGARSAICQPSGRRGSGRPPRRPGSRSGSAPDPAGQRGRFDHLAQRFRNSTRGSAAVQSRSVLPERKVVVVPIEQLTRVGRVRPIVRWGAAILHTSAQPVTDFGPELQNLLADMFAANSAAQGAGLAAPQIGVSQAAFVYDCLDGDSRRQVGLVCNPVVEEPADRDRRLEVWEEGCLSLPGGYADLARLNQVICRGQDQYGDPIELVGTGLLARCFQHETDHLNGTVFGDRLPTRRRRDLYRTHQENAHRYPADWPVSNTVP